jgi:predicted transcriptional regulator
MVNWRFLLITAICCAVLVCSVPALPREYSVLPWMDNAPTGEPKAPVPIEPWQVPPVPALLVLVAIFLPFCLVPIEILVSCAGILVLNFRRIRKERVLENECRASIRAYIVAHPGAGFTEIERGVPVNRGTLEYHLGILRRERLVVAFSGNRRRCYFENGGRFSPSEMDAIARLRTGSNFSICEYLSGSPDASRGDIARWMKTTGSTVSWHMRNLCDARLVSIEKEGKCVTYRLTSAAAEVLEKIGCAPGA